MTAILSLALGIGANTAVFSLLNQVLLQTLPVKNPSELVFFYSPGPRYGNTSEDETGDPSFNYPTFLALQKEQNSFAGLAGSYSVRAALSYRNAVSYGDARLVSGNYFDVLGVRPATGRLLTEDDDRPGGQSVAVLSYQNWTGRFGADPSVLNRTMIVNGAPVTVVGVAQPGFSGERIGRPADLFLPVSMQKVIAAKWHDINRRDTYWITLFGRLKPGVTREQAESEMNVLSHPQLELDARVVQHPRGDFLQRFLAKKIILKPGQYGRGDLREREREPLLLLIAMTTLVLLIACANVANLQLARGVARTREIAVRLALGESRQRLIGELLAESCLLAAVGGACGLIAAQWTLHGIIAAIPPAREIHQILSVDLDCRVLLFSLTVSLATGILFGLFPAFEAAQTDLLTGLKEQAGQFSATRSANLFRRMLASGQIAMSLLLLILAGLFGKTLAKLTNIDTGIRADHLISFPVVPALGSPDAKIAQWHEQLTDRLTRIGGVTLVSSTDTAPITNDISGTYILVPGYTPNSNDVTSLGVILCMTAGVGASYFSTLGVPLISGRDITPADVASAAKVTVVNEAFAKHFFGGQNPIGRYVGDSDKIDVQIIGLVKDGRYDSMRHAAPPVFYRPITERHRWREMTFYLRTAIDPRQIASSIRREVARVSPGMPIGEIRTMQTDLDRNIFDERVTAALTGAFAALATLLAVIGLYGVLAFNVAQRTREIGIRVALGARPNQVRRLVGREMVVLLTAGSLVGIGAAASTGSLIQTYLYEMKARDGPIFVVATVTLWLIALAAAYIPARKATCVDPMVALRCE